MKALYYTILFFFVSVITTAQFVERSMAPVFNSSLRCAVSDSAGNFYLAGSSSWDLGSGQSFSKIDMHGNLLFQVPLPLGEITELTDIDQSRDFNYLLCGSSMSCDIFPSETGFVMKYDSNGNVVWMKMIHPETITGPVDNNFKGLAELPNHNLSVHADSTLFYLSNTGDSIWSIIVTEGISNIGNYGDYIMVSSDSDIVIIDTLGNIINHVPFSGVINYFQSLTDSTFLMMIGSSLFVLDYSLSNLHMIDLFAYDIDASLIAFDTDRICFGNNMGSEFACFDRALMLLDTFQIQTADVFCSSLVVRDTTLFLFGGELALKSNQYFKSFSVSGNYIYHDVDLAITDVNIDTAYAYHTTPFPSGVFALKFVPSVTIKNNGTEEINSFNLNFIYLLHGFCGPGNYTQHFNNISVFPGDSITVTLDTLSEWGLVISQPYNFNYSFCPWVSCPDSVTDKNHSNDQFCDSFLIDEIVFVEEVAEENIQLYPNPVGDELRVNVLNGNMNQDYYIFNSIGEIIDKGTLQSGKISTARLKSGLYLIMIENGVSKMVSRFVKTD